MRPMTLAKEIIIKNSIVKYHDEIERAIQVVHERTDSSARAFDPGCKLPELADTAKSFFSASDISYSELGYYCGRRLRLLDLTHNPGTRTTKTLASLIIVGRAVRYIQDTGASVMIVTPSSANKATALRDSVWRAIDVGLVSPRRLSIMTVVPRRSLPKLWSSPLSEDPLLRRRNPMVLHDGAGAEVKSLALDFTGTCADEFRERHGVELWHTLSLANYMSADSVRAYGEQDCLPSPSPRGRLHVHAVSSAFGLLGHNLGSVLRGNGGPMPRYWLVQHLATPDMVLSLNHGQADRRHLPAYDYDGETGLYRQHSDLRYPTSTFDPDEMLDVTFYTQSPPTSATMNAIIRERGGGGIVVSLHECLERYGQVRALLTGTQASLPADPRELREWSLVMAVTGTLNAIDRELIDPDDDIVIHGSGSYTVHDYQPLAAGHTAMAQKPAELLDIARDAIE
jgi:hypothetical protein